MYGKQQPLAIGSLKTSDSEAGRGDDEGKLVRAGDAVGPIREVKEAVSKFPECAGIFVELHLVHQSSVGIASGNYGNPADIAGVQPERTVEEDVSTLKLDGETRIHGDANRNLVNTARGEAHRPDTSGYSQII